MGHNGQVEEEGNRPKWLLELENRKRKPRLAHELGAGAPCIKCTTSCPGLDLHFWRKICKNCKCSRDDHDVPDEEFPQFDLLFGPSGPPKKKSIILKRQTAEETFEWAPPDTTKELAADYMKALPEEKLPIKGSAGAALRKQQLQKQLPLHDIDHKVCDELTDSERKQFEKYLENLKKYVGQGRVTKFNTARPFDRALMTPANASECFSPKHRAAGNNNIMSNSPNLRTPSSFVTKKFDQGRNINDQGGIYSDQGRNFSDLGGIHDDQGHNLNDQGRTLSPEPTMTPGRRETIASPAFSQTSSENSRLGRYHHVLGEIRAENQLSQSTSVPGPQGHAVPLQFQGRSDQMPANSIRDAVKSPEAHLIHSNATNNKPVNAALNFAQSNIHNELPPSVQRQEIRQDFAISDDKPLRSHHWAKQLGKSENSGSEEENSILAEKMLCDALMPPSSINSNDIVASTLDRKGLSFIREKLASKYGDREDDVQRHSPMKSREISGNQVQKPEFRPPNSLVTQDMINKGVNPQLITSGGVNPSILHSETGPECQNPMKSREFNGNFGQKSDIRGSNPSEITNKPINHQLISSGGFQPPIFHSEISGEGQNPMKSREFNGNFDQKIEIRGSNPPQNPNKPINPQLITSGGINPTILHSETLQNPAFPESSVGTVRTLEPIDNLANFLENTLTLSQPKQKCHQCTEDIVLGDVIVTAEKAKDAAWHPGCFVCSICDELLVDLVYFYQKGKLYCGRDFAALLQIHRCFACDELIFVNEYTVAEGHTYHIKHFCCWDCDKPLAGQQYVSESDRPLCLPCFQKTYAKTCAACKKVIAADQQGVAVKGLDFHATEACFCCANCRKSLLNGRMAIKEDRPFCSKECISEFLNRK